MHMSPAQEAQGHTLLLGQKEEVIIPHNTTAPARTRASHTRGIVNKKLVSLQEKKKKMLVMRIRRGGT